jgi:hypothetical protein
MNGLMMTSYLADVWMPRHPLRAAIESRLRLQERTDRQARRVERELEAG